MSNTVTQELQSVNGASYAEIFGKFRELSAKYNGMPMESLISAYNAANGWFQMPNLYTPNPFAQNRRVKSIGTRPADYSKDDIAGFVLHPDANERPLRAVEKALEYTAYPMYHTRTVYQNLLTYHSYISPSLTDKEDSRRDDFWREWKLLEKLRKELNPKDTAHELTGRALQEGKIFVAPRISVDKPHNQVNYAFLQRLPSDWVKIVGYNNVSKYTVAFDLMYFTQYGTDWRMYGDLFTPYISNFLGSLAPQPTMSGKKVVYAGKTSVDLSVVRKAEQEGVEAYFQNGRWFYWVTLPVDRVFPFEIDDTDENVVPPFTGLFLDMVQLSQMEQIQLELLQNPLVSILTGEIPTWDDKKEDTADPYKISDAGRRMFEALFYQMLSQNSTSGIGLYAAPYKNMKMETLSEAPNAINIVSTGYRDMMAKAGLTAIIPASDEARAGAVQVSFTIESQFAKRVYTCYERMVKALIRKLGLKHEWEFTMFGDLASDDDREKTLKEQMTLGILPAVLEYNAMHERSILDDMAISDAVVSADLMSRRLPLVSGYSQSAKVEGKPPMGSESEGGRPQNDGVTSEGQEQDADTRANAN